MMQNSKKETERGQGSISNVSANDTNSSSNEEDYI